MFTPNLLSALLAASLFLSVFVIRKISISDEEKIFSLNSRLKEITKKYYNLISYNNDVLSRKIKNEKEYNNTINELTEKMNEKYMAVFRIRQDGAEQARRIFFNTVDIFQNFLSVPGLKKNEKEKVFNYVLGLDGEISSEKFLTMGREKIIELIFSQINYAINRNDVRKNNALIFTERFSKKLNDENLND